MTDETLLTPNEVVNPEALSAKEFLESVPPMTKKVIRDALTWASNTQYRLQIEDLYLHCPSDQCNGMRLFTGGSDTYKSIGTTFVFLHYSCKNCGISRKNFAITIDVHTPFDDESSFLKLGEIPAFGPPTPARVASLVGPDRDYYFKGVRSENQGLGIAAFAYYRRVVERRKDEIIDQVIRVSEKVSAPADIISELNAAKKEIQFTKAIEQIKHGIPQTLFIAGQNPLTLLHSALSEGLHAESDAECLELATSIRIVLAAFVERVQLALSNEAELNAAVTRLIQKKSKPGAVPTNNPGLESKS